MGADPFKRVNTHSDNNRSMNIIVHIPQEYGYSTHGITGSTVFELIRRAQGLQMQATGIELVQHGINAHYIPVRQRH